MVLPNVYSLGYTAGHRLHSLLSHQWIPDVPSPYEAFEFVTNVPFWYKDWWLNLVTNDPVHVFVETTLLLSVVYMILVRKTDDWRMNKNKASLSEQEKEQLIEEWRGYGRAPLAPSPEELSVSPQVVVCAMGGRTMEIQVGNEDRKRTVLNFSTHDFLGMSSDSLLSKDDGPGLKVKEASRKALKHYGCGSCGPRGFYGTIDVHLEFEEAISKFIHTEGAIMYSDGASTVSSTIAAFAKRGDLLVVDEGIYEPLVTGVSLSRANIHYFRHNDMADLRRVLQEIQRKDKRLGRKPSAQRRFLVVEGLYKNSGTICPLDQVVALKNEFNYRLIIDESFSFGTLGKTGRGALELYGKKPMYDAEIVTISLENSLGSIGGVTVGNEEVVDHQRLSGAGYCFSASSPPFTATAAIAALDEMENRPELLEKLRENVVYFHQEVKSILSDIVPKRLILTSDEKSPLIFLELSDMAGAFLDKGLYPDNVSLLDAIASECIQCGIAVVSTGFHVQGNMKTVPPPAIRMTVSAVHSRADIDTGLNALKKAVLKVMK